MSGSSSSGRSFLGGIAMENPTVDCSSLKRSTKVVSPTMIYFKTVFVGTILKVELDDSKVILLDSSDNAVGSIIPAWIGRLIDCINDGYQFEAIINNMNGASIDVTIQHKV
ncbi:MAG: hypothetical protein MJK08_06630 [Campylobacterales bacterium]|nr:hypothetical protein [Campylobacterales bacterium]